MNKQDALYFFNGIELRFVNYFKYIFTYEGTKDNTKVLVHFGGDSSDIYRDEFNPIERFQDIGFENFQVTKSSKDNTVIYVFSEN